MIIETNLTGFIIALVVGLAVLFAMKHISIKQHKQNHKNKHA